VTGIATAIGTIKVSQTTSATVVSWFAGGVLSDHNFDDSYSWCYYFTVVGWNEAVLGAAV
jgi:hypothetical protein